MMQRFLGDKAIKSIISSKTANPDAKILNPTDIFRSSEFFCEPNGFCREACGSAA